MQQYQNAIQDQKITCVRHNQEAIFINLGKCQIKENRFLCENCNMDFGDTQLLMSQNEALTIIKRKQKEIQSQKGQFIALEIKKIVDLIEQITKMKKIVYKSIDSIEQQFIDWKNEFIKFQASLTTINLINEIDFLINYQIGRKQNYTEEVEKQVSQFYKEYLSKTQKQIKEVSQEFQKFKSTINDSFLKIISKKSETTLEKYNSLNIKQVTNSDKYNTVNIKQVTATELKYSNCLAFDFNRNNNLLAVAVDNEIIIYCVENNKFEQIDILKGHTSYIIFLIFSKINNWIISGGNENDKSIRLWKEMKNKDWSCGQFGKNHSGSIKCLLTNQQESLLFSSSSEEVIIWRINFEEMVNIYFENISLNSSENTLVASSTEGAAIAVTSLFGNYKLTQKIKISAKCFYVAFIKENEFILQDYENGHCRIYKKQDNRFILRDSLKLDDQGKDSQIFFPCKFNNTLSTLFLKHNLHIYVIKQEKSGQLAIKNSIKLQNSKTIGKSIQDETKIAIINEKYLILYELRYLVN